MDIGLSGHPGPSVLPLVEMVSKLGQDPAPTRPQ